MSTSRPPIVYFSVNSSGKVVLTSEDATGTQTTPSMDSIHLTGSPTAPTPSLTLLTDASSTRIATTAFVQGVASNITGGSNTWAGLNNFTDTFSVVKDQDANNDNSLSVNASGIWINSEAGTIKLIDASQSITMDTSGIVINSNVKPLTLAAHNIVIDASNSLRISKFNSAGVVHSNASGILSSSLIVNGDISNNTIELGKLATSVYDVSANIASTLVQRDTSGFIYAATADASDNSTKVATTSYVNTRITNLIDGATGTLDTLKELADAINNDASYAANMITTLTGKVNTSSLDVSTNAVSSVVQRDTSGNINNAQLLNPTFKSTVTLSGATAGIVHSNASGILSSSLIVNGDISNNTIELGKLASSVYDVSTNAVSTLVQRDINGNINNAQLLNPTLKSTVTLSGATAGIVHSNASGILSSSLIVNGDISNNTIELGKLATSVYDVSANIASTLVQRDISGYIYSVTTDASDNSTKVATTEYVLTKIGNQSAISLLPSTSVQNQLTNAYNNATDNNFVPANNSQYTDGYASDYQTNSLSYYGYEYLFTSANGNKIIQAWPDTSSGQYKLQTFTSGGSAVDFTSQIDSMANAGINGVICSMSDDGTYILFATKSGSGAYKIYLSTDGGTTFTAITALGTAGWTSVAMSSDGKYMYAAQNGDRLWRSDTYGINGSWYQSTTNITPWSSVCTSSNGQTVYGTIFIGEDIGIWKSTNYGLTFEKLSYTYTNNNNITTNINKAYKKIICDGAGSYISVISYNSNISSNIVVSYNGGTSWYEPEFGDGINGKWYDIAMSKNGKVRVAVQASLDPQAYPSYSISYSNDYGDTFNFITTGGSATGVGVDSYQISVTSSDVYVITTSQITTFSLSDPGAQVLPPANPINGTIYFDIVNMKFKVYYYGTWY